MTDRELRRLSRKDLLELLISQGRERDALQAELERIKAELENRQLCMEQAGSIETEALIQAMTEITVDGLTGQVTFEESGEPAKTAKYVQIVNGEYTAM